MSAAKYTVAESARAESVTDADTLRTYATELRGAADSLCQIANNLEETETLSRENFERIASEFWPGHFKDGAPERHPDGTYVANDLQWVWIVWNKTITRAPRA